jgi:hypothetical protein
MNQTLLVELQTEELPPKALVKLGAAFATGIANGLKARDFLEADSTITTHATPLRLAVSITNVRGTAFMVRNTPADWFEINSTEVDTPGRIEAHVTPYLMGNVTPSRKPITPRAN